MEMHICLLSEKGRIGTQFYYVGWHELITIEPGTRAAAHFFGLIRQQMTAARIYPAAQLAGSV